MRTRAILPALLVILLAAAAAYPQQYPTIDPSAFENISHASLNILQVFKEYDNLIADNNFRTILNARGASMSEMYSVSTTAGDVIVHPFQADLLFHSRGFVLVASMMDLRIAKLFNEGLPFEYLLPYGWSYRYAIAGYRLLGRRKGNDLTIGVMLQQKPYLEEGAGGEKVFGYLDKGYTLLTSTVSTTSPFIHFNIFGNDVATIYSTEEGDLDSAEYEFSLPLGERTGRLNLGYNYSRFTDNSQAVVKYKELHFTRWAMFGVEYSQDVTTSRLSYIQPEVTIFLAWEGKKAAEKLDRHTKLHFGYSYDREIFGEGVSGYTFDVSFENLKLYKDWAGSVSIGLANNYRATLNRIPIRDELLITGMLQFTK